MLSRTFFGNMDNSSSSLRRSLQVLSTEINDFFVCESEFGRNVSISDNKNAERRCIETEEKNTSVMKSLRRFAFHDSTLKILFLDVFTPRYIYFRYYPDESFNLHY